MIVGRAAASLAFAEEERPATTTDAGAAVTSETTADKKPAAEVGKAALEKQIKENPDKVDWSKIDGEVSFTRMQYYIMREAGTERAFQNKFWDFFKPG